MRSLKGRSRGRPRLKSWGDHGATAVEYGLMVAFIMLAVIVGVTAFGSTVKGLFESVTATAPFN